MGVVCAHNPSIGKVETSRPQGSLASQLAYLAFPAREVRGLYTVTQ